jgi:hypothetical protein
VILCIGKQNVNFLIGPYAAMLLGSYRPTVRRWFGRTHHGTERHNRNQHQQSDNLLHINTPSHISYQRNRWS